MRKKKFPTRVRFFIADDVRMDGAKPMLIGFFPDDLVLVPMDAKDPEPSHESKIGLQGLTILVSFIDCHGHFEVRTSLHEPGGAAIIEKQEVAGGFGTATAPEKANINFVAKFMPFLIPSFGKYRFVISLDKKEYPYEFNVTRQEATPGSPRPVSLVTLQPAKKAKPKSPSRKKI